MFDHLRKHEPRCVLKVILERECATGGKGVNNDDVTQLRPKRTARLLLLLLLLLLCYEDENQLRGEFMNFDHSQKLVEIVFCLDILIQP